MTYQLFYDADCPICQHEMSLLRLHNPARNIKTIPVQGNETRRADYGISREHALTLIHLITPDGQIISGMPALRLVYAQCNRPMTRLWNLPILRQISDWGYPYFARYRHYIPRWLIPRPHCKHGSCRR